MTSARLVLTATMIDELQPLINTDVCDVNVLVLAQHGVTKEHAERVHRFVHKYMVGGREGGIG